MFDHASEFLSVSVPSAKQAFFFSNESRRVALRVVLLLSFAQCLALPACAQPQWSKPTNEQVVLTLGGVGTAVALRLTNSNLSEPRWSLLLPFERGVRDALRPATREEIEVLRDISDVLLRSMLLAPYLVDIPIGVGRYGSRGIELGVIALHAEAFTMLITEASKYLLSRARPYSYTCGGDTPDWRCASKSINESMISGHSAGAFSGAGLLCSFHVRGDLADNDILNYSICGASIAVAATTALLRVATDDHHLTDVILGSLVGFVIGYGLPIWLYNMGDEPSALDPTSSSANPLTFSYGMSF